MLMMQKMQTKIRQNKQPYLFQFFSFTIHLLLQRCERFFYLNCTFVFFFEFLLHLSFTSLKRREKISIQHKRKERKRKSQCIEQSQTSCKLWNYSKLFRHPTDGE